MNPETSGVARPPLTLYFSPKACSLASHIALEETGLEYQSVAIDIRAGANRSADYLAINPSGAVPTLTVGETAVTESHALLTFIADQAPERRLLPAAGSLSRARAHEWMNWISSSMHTAFRSVFRPQVYAGEAQDVIVDAVRSHAMTKLAQTMIEVERRLDGAPFALGEFSVVDAYLFVFYLWSFDERLPTALPARPGYAALADAVWRRSAVRKV